jgi:hypothetical protein
VFRSRDGIFFVFSSQSVVLSLGPGKLIYVEN